MFAVNSAHIVNGTLNLNETVQLANCATRDVLLSASETDSAVPEMNGHVEADGRLPFPQSTPKNTRRALPVVGE